MLDKMSARVLPRISPTDCWLTYWPQMGALGRDLTLSSAFLAIQHLATPSSTCTCPRRFPISVMMLMAESYLGKAVCTARGRVQSDWARPAAPPSAPQGPHLQVPAAPVDVGKAEQAERL